MRWTLAIAAALCACGGDDPVGDIDYRVESYDVSIDLIDETSTVSIEFEVTQGGDCLSIPSRLAPQDARWNGKTPSAGEYSDGSILLCGSGVEAGGSLVVEVDASLTRETWGDLQVGYSVSEDIEGESFRYLVSWIGGCTRFGPCDAAPDRFARYRFEVTHDPSETVLCSGTITSEPGVTVCETDYRAPTYSAFGLASSSSWTPIDLGTWGGVPVTFYDMPSSATADRIKGDVHDLFLAWMSERFGPYPFGDELRLAVGPTVWNGFEHPDNIILNDDLRNEPLGGGYEDRLTHVINHEIAHMWAGNSTTIASEKDFVLKEATVEYLTFVFEDEVLGGTTAQRTASAWKGFSRAPLFYPVPGEDAPLIDFYGDSYGPGQMIMFRQLEALVGERAPIMAALADVLQAETAISVTDVQAALETHTGLELDVYFDTWLRGTGSPEWPRFSITYDQVGDQVTVQVDQTSPAKPMGCAFAVELQGPSGEIADVWIDRGLEGQASVSVTDTVAFAVQRARLDPHAQCLAFSPSATGFARRNPWLAH